MKKELLYGELSYKIVGLLYKVNDEIGYGQKEKVYCDAFEQLLKDEGINFKREHYCPITISGHVIAKRYFDFLVDDKIIVEFKAGETGFREVCTQIFQYLKQSGYKLGLIARYTKTGVKVKRIPCFY